MKYTFNVASYNFETIAEMHKWCMKHLYHGGYYRQSHWSYHNNVFTFTDEQEYMWFKLKWM